MKLQKGKFLINGIDELKNISVEEDGVHRLIDLEYMGQFEYEGNAIPISRMFIEYFREDYHFYPTQIFNKEGKQMYIYANCNLIIDKIKDNPNYISNLARFNIERNFSLWEYINKSSNECSSDFWWDIEGDYFIIFGDDKKDLINLFINECYHRDGGKELIKRKLLKAGYKIKN